MVKLKELEHPVVIAHRGFRSKYPENTLIAFDAAIQAGAPMIELDVTLSKDRKIVVIHDDTVNRTTNGTGNVKALTLAELKNLDAGTWFDTAFQDERLPTLEEVVDMAVGRAAINIEIKQSAYESDDPPDSIEKQVMDLILEKNIGDAVLVSSFEKEILFRMRKLSPHIPVSFLTEVPYDDGILSTLKQIGAYSWNPDFRTVLHAHIQKIRYAGFRVMPFTINSETVAKKLMEAGISGFFTDDPTLLSH